MPSRVNSIAVACGLELAFVTSRYSYFCSPDVIGSRALRAAF